MEATLFAIFQKMMDAQTTFDAQSKFLFDAAIEADGKLHIDIADADKDYIRYFSRLVSVKDNPFDALFQLGAACGFARGWDEHEKSLVNMTPAELTAAVRDIEEWREELKQARRDNF